MKIIEIKTKGKYYYLLSITFLLLNTNNLFF